MQKTCAQCPASFEITAEDLAFYEKVSPVFGGKKLLIPPPTLCPDCRQQRRLSWRNERNLCRRTCDLCKKEVVSIYRPPTPFPVYCNECWWGDTWDALHSGKNFDFSRPFFEQFKKLQNEVPRNALYKKNAINSDYCNHSLDLKNCYLGVCVGGGSENVYYSKWIIKSRDICDSYQLVDSELCFGSLYSNACYNCIVSIRSEDCRDCAFLYNCQGCSDCFCCWNLRHKQYCYRNKQLTKKEYQQLRAVRNLGSAKQFQAEHTEFLDCIITQAIRQAIFMRACEESTGDFLVRCNNVHNSFDVENAQDCRYCYGSEGLRDCYDINEAAFGCTLQCDCQSCDAGNSTLFSHTSYYNSDMLCSDSCHSCTSIFGCIGMRNAHCCILNRQYTKKDYESLIPKIVEHMRKTPYQSPANAGSGTGQAGEWGEFFPVSMSPFVYNETVASEYFPLPKKEVLSRGWKWQDQTDEIPEVSKIIPAEKLPDSIDDIPDDILHWAIKCETTRRPFRIIKQELDLYRTMRLPIPHLHPDERHRRRMALRNPRKLWQRKCTKCGKEIRTTYSLERPETVYCEECYLKEVY